MNKINILYYIILLLYYDVFAFFTYNINYYFVLIYLILYYIIYSYIPTQNYYNIKTIKLNLYTCILCLCVCGSYISIINNLYYILIY